MLFGRRPNIPGILQKETPEIPYTHDNYVKELQARLQSSYETARSNLQGKKEKSKEYHDRTANVPLFVVGDKVLLHDETVRRGRSSKLSKSWIGPYDIISLDDVNVTLKLPRNRTLKVHTNRLKPFFWLNFQANGTQILVLLHVPSSLCRNNSLGCDYTNI
jgi:hypothetical protein